MKPHPAADIFPLLDGTALAALVEDIKANGQIHPIVTYGGAVLDGRNRLNACYAAGVKPKFSEYTGKDPLGYVVGVNLHRRHLDASQRAMLGARLLPLFEADALERKLGGLVSKETKGRSSEKAASAVNVSRAGVSRAAKVLGSGSAATIRAVENGELAVTRAAEIAELPKSEQRAAVKEEIERQPDYSEDDERAEYAADFEAMAKIIDSDDKLSAAVGELRVVRKTLASVERVLAGKDESLAQMTKEAARWMRKAKKSAACQDCMTALERP